MRVEGENPFWRNCVGWQWCTWWMEGCRCTKVSFLG